MIFFVSGVPGAYETVGIESPGLTSAPAIARLLVGTIAENEHLTQKADFKPAIPLPKPFNEMNDDERRQAIAENPLICVAKGCGEVVDHLTRYKSVLSAN